MVGRKAYREGKGSGDELFRRHEMGSVNKPTIQEKGEQKQSQ